MGAERDLKSAQSGVERSQALIKQAETQIASAKASGRSTASGERLLAAAKQNLAVFQGRAQTAFQEVAKIEFAKRQAQAERERKKQIAAQKAEEARKKKEAELIAQRKATEESKRLQEQRAKAEQAALLDVAKTPAPIATTGEESQLQKLGQRREDVIEKLEKTQAIERLESGTTVFETGAGFKPVKIDSGAGQVFKRPDGTIFVVRDGQVSELPNFRTVDPSSSEGSFIAGQIQSQQVDTLSDLLDVEKQIAIIKSEEPGTAESKFAKDTAGVTALETAQQTRGIEATPDLFPGETILGTAEEFGVAVPAKIKVGPGEFVTLPKISGSLFAEVESPGQLADRVNKQFIPGSDFVVEGGQVTEFVRTPLDPFQIAQEEREQTGLIPGEPVSFGSLLGFDSPPPKKKQEPTKITKSNDPLQAIAEAGLQPTSQQISSGIIPFAPVTQQALPVSDKKAKKGQSVFQQQIPEIDVPSTKNIGLPPLPSAGLVSGARTVLPTVETFGDFLGDLGKSLGIGGTSFFDTISKGVSFSSIFGGPTKTKLTDAQKAKKEIDSLKRRGGSIPVSLINEAFPEKSKQAKQLGFQLNSQGEFVEGRRSEGTLTGVKGSLTQVQFAISERKRKEAERKKQEDERKRKAAIEAANKKRRKKIRKTTIPKKAKIIVGSSSVKLKPKPKPKTKSGKTTRKSKSSSFTSSTRKLRNPFESFGFGDRSGFF